MFVIYICRLSFGHSAGQRRRHASRRADHQHVHFCSLMGTEVNAESNTLGSVRGRSKAVLRATMQDPDLTFLLRRRNV